MNGTYEVTQYDAGLTTYQIRCTDGVRYGVRSLRVMWNLSPPSLLFVPADSSGWQGDTMRLFWRSTLHPCTASGGDAGDGWAGSKVTNGEQFVPLLRTGAIRYTMTCGSGSTQVTQTAEVSSRAPIAELTPASNNMRVNNEVLVMQSAAGATCTRSGGAPGDGWAAVTGSYPLRLTSAVPGTFHYVLTCHGGPNGSPTSAEASMDLTFTNDPPVATLSASPSIATVIPPGPLGGDLTPYFVGLSWTSNVAPCQLTYDGPGDEDGNVNPGRFDLSASGSWNAIGTVVGAYVFRVTCTRDGITSTATTTAQFVPPAPAVAVYLQTATPVANEPFQLGWSATTSPCVASGGAAGDGWAGAMAGTSGGKSVTLTAQGTYVYGVSCGVAPDIASGSVSVTIGAPAVAFEPHDAEALVGRGVILRWVSTVGPCTQTGEWANTATHPAISGNVVISSSPGTRTYGIRCGTTTVVEASTQVAYLPQPTVDITASVASINVNQPVTLS